MDSTHREPHDLGDDPRHTSPGGGAGAQRPGPARRPPRHAPDPGSSLPAAPARTAEIICADYLLTVNPVDGSEVERCPPARRPARPTRLEAAERAAARRATPLATPTAGDLPLLEREDVRERLTGLLARGRTVRLTGPSGSGRSAVLDAVAADCADLAPDGVVRLSGLRRTVTDVLHELYAAVYRTPGQRPDAARLTSAVRDIGAVVILDDVELGDRAWSELLDATPECAYLFSTVPGAPELGGDAYADHVRLPGLSLNACLELMERGVRRPLTEEEAGWGSDLWFESEGLPLRFVQAGALLRQRGGVATATDGADGDAPGAVSGSAPAASGGTDRAGRPAESDAETAGAVGRPLPPPTLAEGAAPVAELAAGVGEAARATLRFALALGGQCPYSTQLPALTGDPHADGALTELLASGLVTAAGPGYQLAVGVADQLRAAGYGAPEAPADAATGRPASNSPEPGEARRSEQDQGDVSAAGDPDASAASDGAYAVAQHYVWWAGHPSVESERVCQEADVILAAVSSLLADRRPGHASVAVLLARTAAPAFAAGRHWGAWERCLRHGQEASRMAGEVAEEAYFHHELGVLALCTGNLDRARAELEASIGLRGVLADRRGAVAGRRALALVSDRAQGTTRVSKVVTAPSAQPDPGAASASKPAGPGTTLPPVAGAPADRGRTARSSRLAGTGAGGRLTGTPWAALLKTRRNAFAAVAGALLIAVLGTVVTLGAMSDGDSGTAERDTPSRATLTDDEGDDDASTDVPATHDSGPGTPARTGSGDVPTTAPGTSAAEETPREHTSSGAPATSESAGDSASESGDGSTTPSGSPTPSHGDDESPSEPPESSEDPTGSGDPTESEDPEEPTEPGEGTEPTDGATNSVSRTAGGPDSAGGEAE